MHALRENFTCHWTNTNRSWDQATICNCGPLSFHIGYTELLFILVYWQDHFRVVHALRPRKRQKTRQITWPFFPHVCNHENLFFGPRRNSENNPSFRLVLWYITLNIISFQSIRYFLVFIRTIILPLFTFYNYVAS